MNKQSNHYIYIWLTKKFNIPHCIYYVKPLNYQVIISFKDKTTHDIYHGINLKASRSIPKSIWKTATRKLDMLNAASELRDLKIPPANKLEKLKGNLKSFYSIRINDQFRLFFNGTIKMQKMLKLQITIKGKKFDTKI